LNPNHSPLQTATIPTRTVSSQFRHILEVEKVQSSRFLQD
jgi:hypothetical protein